MKQILVDRVSDTMCDISYKITTLEIKAIHDKVQFGKVDEADTIEHDKLERAYAILADTLEKLLKL
ncbi:MAG: hypothetical protein M0R51_08975 [Clostridia bacterium]|jgi:hypothetical protein|nr:hypothetical protein [Clostridia bacterium]